MTEATGGITMTPPGKYRRGTVGVALPGVEVLRAEDGELLCRGPYMMLGYDDAGRARARLPDRVVRDGRPRHAGRRGYVTIVDRKKDIYKNVKGQTIAPQRIENMFTEFEEIKRVFLVGDGREYNTLLIYPDYDAAGGKLARMSPDDLREYLSSFVVSVNRFLAPFERVVDFELLPRYFREDKGELTPKGTFVRKVVERNFSDLIDGLYARAYVTLRLERIEVRVPTWLLREKGITADGLVSEPGGIRLRGSGDRLTIGRMGGTAGHIARGKFRLRGRSGGTRRTCDRGPRSTAARPALLGRECGARPLRRRRTDPPSQARNRAVRTNQRRELATPGPAAGRSAAPIRGGGPQGGTRRFRRACGGRAPARGARRGRAPLPECAGGLPRGSRRRRRRPTCGRILPLLRFHGDGEIRRRALSILLPLEVDQEAGETLRRFLAVDADVLSTEVISEHPRCRDAVGGVAFPARRRAGPRSRDRPMEAGGRSAAGRVRAQARRRSRRAAAAVVRPARRTLVHRAMTDRDGEIAQTRPFRARATRGALPILDRFGADAADRSDPRAADAVGTRRGVRRTLRRPDPRARSRCVP